MTQMIMMVTAILTMMKVSALIMVILQLKNINHEGGNDEDDYGDG